MQRSALGLSKFRRELAYRNALVCSVSFFLLFVAFGAAQNFATSANGNVGAISLGIVYGSLTLFNIFIPQALEYISPKYVLRIR